MVLGLLSWCYRQRHCVFIGFFAEFLWPYGMWLKYVYSSIYLSFFVTFWQFAHTESMSHLFAPHPVVPACIFCPGSTLHPDSSYLEHNLSCWEQDAPLLLPLSDVTQILHNDSVWLCSVSLSLLPSSFLWYQPLLRAFSQEDITFGADQAIMCPSLEIDFYHFWLPAATALTKFLNRVKKKKKEERKKKIHLIRQAFFLKWPLFECSALNVDVGCLLFWFVFSIFCCCFFFTHLLIDSTRAVVGACAKTQDNFCSLLG